MGEEVAKFESEFADWLGCKYAVMVNSGSSANLAMISALMFRSEARLARGDEIIVPAVSWSTTYSPLWYNGLRLKLVDVDPDTLNIDPVRLENAITNKTKAIIAVNLLGNPTDFNQLQHIADSNDLILLEDNCESLGATFGGQQAGTFGVMGTFSFFFSHHISTMEGGAIVTDDEELCHILRCLRAHGWTRDLPSENWVSGRKSGPDFEESFRFVLPGFNVRPLEMSGAVGRRQLEKLPSFVAIRRQNADHFTELFQSHPWLRLQKEVGASSWFGFSLVLKPNAPTTREELVKRLQSEGIDTRPIVAGNFAKQKAINWFDQDSHSPLENAQYLDEHGLFVGNHHYDLRSEIDHLWQVCHPPTQ
jgi:CDP-6-deoxy-D-xylo-4-hexulose-3-dehydrase